MVDQVGHRHNELDGLLGHDIAGGRLGGKHEGAGLEGGVGVGLDVQVHAQDLEHVEQLALVLMQALNLHIEQGIGVHIDAVAL